MASTVTAVLMGDPKPNRQELSDAIRARVCKTMPEDAGPADVVVAVLEALADGPMTLLELSVELGLSLSAGSDRAYRARQLGLIDKTRARPCKVFLTSEGEGLIG